LVRITPCFSCKIANKPIGTDYEVLKSQTGL
jgi:hypothetical protein